jgi:hypothetical protein
MGPIDNECILDFFRSRIERLTGTSAKEYAKAFAYLDSFLSGSDDSFVSPTEKLIEDWSIVLLSSGMTQSTIIQYIGVVSALYSAAAAEGLVRPTDVFKTVKAKIKKDDFLTSVRLLSEEQYMKMHNLAIASPKLPENVAMYVDIFVLSILTGCKPPIDVAMYKKSDVTAQPPQIATILERHCGPRRQFVFNLGQSTKTPVQLEQHLYGKITSVLLSNGINIINSVEETARGFWAFAAMKCGISPSDIFNVLGKLPAAMPDRSMRASSARISGDRNSIINAVSETFLYNPFNWYAMKLRPRVKISDVEKRMHEVDVDLHPAELFYPWLAISRKIKNKKQTVRQPIIPDIIFFKSRMTDVRPLFLKLGDLAWCYRKSAGGEYSVISRAEMEQFQRTIGKFTSDYEVGPIGSITPRPGDTIKIIGGLFSGTKGELVKIMEHPEKGTIYRLRIIDDRGIEWRIGVDSRLAVSTAAGQS